MGMGMVMGPGWIGMRWDGRSEMVGVEQVGGSKMIP
jgi:hypothetical protein